MKSVSIKSDITLFEDAIKELKELVQLGDGFLQIFNATINSFGYSKTLNVDFETTTRTDEIIIVIKPGNSFCELLSTLRTLKREIN